MRTHRFAFSLLELLVVLVIVGISAAVIAPKYAASLCEHRADTTAQRIVSDLELARQEAITVSSNRQVDFDNSLQRYTLVGVSHLDRSSDEYVVNLAGGCELVSVDLGGDGTIIYNGFGVPDSGGTITLTCRDELRTITVDETTGRATID